MPTLLLDEPETVQSPNVDFADRLRTTMAAVRVCFTWFGTRKSLSSDQKAQAAESFGAEGSVLDGGQETARFVASRVQSGHGCSRPYPQPLERDFVAVS